MVRRTDGGKNHLDFFWTPRPAKEGEIPKTIGATEMVATSKYEK